MFNLSSILGGNWFGSLLSSLLVFFGLKKIERAGSLKQENASLKREVAETEKQLEKVLKDADDVKAIHDRLITDSEFSSRVRDRFTRD